MQLLYRYILYILYERLFWKNLTHPHIYYSVILYVISFSNYPFDKKKKSCVCHLGRSKNSGATSRQRIHYQMYFFPRSFHLKQVESPGHSENPWDSEHEEHLLPGNGICWWWWFIALRSPEEGGTTWGSRGKIVFQANCVCTRVHS